jgi:RIO-like serine/threonine protein kinase
VIFIKTYGGYDVNQLEFIGKGIHGRVYKIDSERCIKIFKKNEFYKKELETLQMAQKDVHFTKLISWGENYIIREFVDGIELDKYLKKNPLTSELSLKILQLYDSIVNVGFSRHDTMLFHIFITKNGDLKIIDTARVMKDNYTCPKLILKGLKEVGYREDFLNHVKLLRPDLYVKWNS